MKTGPKPRSLQDAWNYLMQRRVMDGECWLYIETQNIGIGYKTIFAKGKRWYIHALAYYLHNGEIQPGNVHRHTCHKPNCFNPSHIIEGTQADNIKDKQHSGRQPVGTEIYNAKLNENAVRHIRQSKENLGELSRKFNVSRSSIKQVRDGKSWKHVQ
jgi:hypothetical protein